MKLGLLSVATVLVIVSVATILSYSRLSVDTASVTALRPALNLTTGSIASATVRALSGDPIKAVAEVVEGLDIELVVEVRNGGFAPVYVSDGDHVVLLNGVEVTDPFRTRIGWIGSGTTTKVPIATRAVFDRLPEAVVRGLIGGGVIEVAVKSSFGLGPLRATTVSEVLEFNGLETLDLLANR